MNKYRPRFFSPFAEEIIASIGWLAVMGTLMALAIYGAAVGM